MLNWTHIHLMINHVPVIGLAVPIAFLLIDRARKNQKLGWLSLQMFVVFAVLTIPVYLTGSPASHKMREVPGISLEIIHRHSSAADFAFWTMEGLGAFSLGMLYKFRSSGTVPPRLTTYTLALALTALGLMIWTANLGGKIRHPEIGAFRFYPNGVPGMNFSLFSFRSDPVTTDGGSHPVEMGLGIEDVVRFSA